MAEQLESYNQFLEANNTTHSPEEVKKYFDALYLYRVGLAKELGKTLGELHLMPSMPKPTDQNQQTVAA
jgi:hypothetical protein